jgi:hypothetical protein
VNDAAINNLTVKGDEGAESALRFINTQDTLVTGARLLGAAPVFLAVEGAKSANIKIDGGDFSKAGKPLTINHEASAESVKLRE